ncbi:SCO family protein [Marinobacter fonticola]|uniref:SCO family protein n=1 Tax=Marinobacter fonticola TaxID=2603215 RepID=UPI00143DB5A0|nr:SCO family protein [Marinobacter fonticola]
MLLTLSNESGYYGFRTDVEVPPLDSSELSIVFFGYGHCDDVCPPQLANLYKISQRLTDLPIHYVFVSLMPSQDKDGAIARTLEHFGPNFRLNLPPSEEAARRLAHAYQANVNGIPRNGRLDHNAFLHVVTKAGRKVLVYPTSNLDLERLQEDMHRLIAEVRPFGPSTK